MGSSHRPLKIRRRKETGHQQTLTLEAVEHLIDNRTESLQEQIKVLQSNAMTTMVILGDLRNSALLAASSTESTKRCFEEYISNIDSATVNIQQYIGAPQSILNYTESHVMQEDLNTLRDAMIATDTTSEEEDIIENVSEDYEEGDYERALAAAEAEAEAYTARYVDNREDMRRRRRQGR